MSTSLLEQTRQYHEDIEILERCIVQDLKSDPKSHRENILQDQRVNAFCDKMMQRASDLAKIYEDTDGTRKDEVLKMSAQGEKLFSTFYERLRQTKEYNRKFTRDEEAVPLDEQGLPLDAVAKFFHQIDEDALVQFSGEEGFGRYLGLVEPYDRFCNTKYAKKQYAGNLDYLQYLTIFHQFDDIPEHTKNADYRSYVTDLLAYVAGFHARVHPLTNAEESTQKMRTEFDDAWANSKVPGWTKAEESDPLFCPPCGKRFAKDSVFEAHLSGKKHVAASKKAGMNGNAGRATANIHGEEVAFIEYQIAEYANLLADQINATRSHIEKKQTRTLEELEAEGEDEMDVDDESEEEEESVVYNPLNLPLGWDGKPIPYWLYKLHGLNIEYKCEICGNFSYWGRRNFERHFQEWRHAHGMRCLRIQNTKHFADITNIEDAYALADKLKSDNSGKAFVAEVSEEYEDSEGNVFNKKTYEDLARQGLL